MNGTETNGADLDGIKLKKSQATAANASKEMPIMKNGHTDGALDDSNEGHEDPSRALQLLRSYGHLDGISIEEVSTGQQTWHVSTLANLCNQLMDETKTGGLYANQSP